MMAAMLMGEACGSAGGAPLHDMSAWRVTIPAIASKPEIDNPRKYYYSYVMDVNRLDVLEGASRILPTVLAKEVMMMTSFMVLTAYNEFVVTFLLCKMISLCVLNLQMTSRHPIGRLKGNQSLVVGESLQVLSNLDSVRRSFLATIERFVFAGSTTNSTCLTRN